MAKGTNTAEKLDNLYDGLTPEQVAEMLALTGQAANSSYEKAPVLKVNYFAKKDKDGNKIELGNFVLGQKISLKEITFGIPLNLT